MVIILIKKKGKKNVNITYDIVNNCNKILYSQHIKWHSLKWLHDRHSYSCMTKNKENKDDLHLKWKKRKKEKLLQTIKKNIEKEAHTLLKLHHNVVEFL